MTVHATEWTMISDLTPESAYRESGSGSAVWRLSWLPDRLLTREQAFAGMELDEILSDPDMVHDRMAHAHAANRADALGIIWEQAVILLSKRIMHRLREDAYREETEAGEPGVTGRLRSQHISLHGAPRVRG